MRTNQRTRWSASSSGLTCLALLLIGPVRDAHAQDPAPAKHRVAVTQVTAHGVLEAALPRFVKSVEGGLAAAGLKVMGRSKVWQILLPESGLAGCETSVCLQRIAKLTKSALCTRATVEKTGDAYRLEVVVSLGKTGQAVVTKEKRCAPCNLNEATDTLARTAREAADEALKKNVLPRPRIRRPPPRPDGRRKPPKPVIEHKPDPKVRLLKWSGIGGMIAGGLALIPGAVLLAMHGKTKDSGCGAPYCAYDTKVGGGILAGFGTAALIGGAVLFTMAYLRDRRRSRERHPAPHAWYETLTLGVDPSGRGALLQGRFQF